MKNIRGKQVKKILFILGLSAFLFSSCGSKPKTDDGVSQKIESDISEAVEETKENVEENIELTDNSEILKSLNSAREAALSSGCETLCPEQVSSSDLRSFVSRSSRTIRKPAPHSL